MPTLSLSFFIVIVTVEVSHLRSNFASSLLIITCTSDVLGLDNVTINLLYVKTDKEISSVLEKA